MKKPTLIAIALICLTSLFMNCGGSSSSSSSSSDPNPNTQTASTVCTSSTLTALENKITASLQAVVTDHSFYFELRRPGIDNRKYTFNRNIDGVVDENTTLQSASTTKMISASVILDVIANPQLYPGAGKVNNKQLSLDSLARDFLPDGAGGTYWKTNTGTIPANNRLYNVTLRHLLSFTSGLELENSLGGPECLAAPASSYTHGGCVQNLVTVNLSRNTNPASNPRTFYYNGAHLSVAALMAVKAAGVTNWAQLFKIFKSAHGVFSGTVAANTSLNDFGPGAFFVYSNGGSPSPAGALRYRAGDYGYFLSQLQSGQILPANLLAEMMSDQMATLGISTIEYSPLLSSEPAEDWHYGLGLWNECEASAWSESCWVDRYSSPGSFGSYPFIDLNYDNTTSYPLIGFVGRGGNDSGTADKGISIYRALRNSTDPSSKDLAQQWAANSCP